MVNGFGLLEERMLLEIGLKELAAPFNLCGSVAFFDALELGLLDLDRC